MRNLAFIALWFASVSVSAMEAVSIRDYAVFDDADGPSAVTSFSNGTLAMAVNDGRTVILTFPDGRKRSIEARAGGVLATEGRLIVAEATRLRTFSAAGDELPNLADANIRDFSQPKGMTVDERGNIYVADRGRDVIFVLSPDGLPLSIIGEDADDEAELSNPVDVAVDGRGRVFIADAGNDRIAIYSTGGVYRGQIESIKNPVAVACDSSGLVYVADAGQNRILRYDASGRLLGSFGSKGRTRGQFRTIIDMEIGPDGLLRVLDSANKSLHVLSWPAPEIAGAARILPVSARWESVSTTDLRPIGTSFENHLVAANENGDVIVLDTAMTEIARLPSGTFTSPSSAIADAERLYVADRGTGEVKVFDRALAPLFTFGKGTRILFLRGGEGKLIHPSALALSSKGLVAVADDNKVEIYGPDGAYMATIGKDEIAEPVGVAFGPDGAIFVADGENESLSRYESSGNFSRSVGKLEPLAMTADEDGRIYLLDGNGPRILVYSPDLEPLMTIGNDGLGVGGLRGATSIIGAKDALHLDVKYGIATIALDLPLPAPATPAAIGGMRSIALTWPKLSVDAVRGFRVTIDTLVRETSGTGLVFDGLLDERTYRASVAAINRFGHSGYSSESVVAKTVLLAMAAPAAPKVTSGIRLSWPRDASPYVTSYAIEGLRLGTFERIATSTLPEIVIDGTGSPGGIRRFRIRAISDNGTVGPPSPEGVYVAGEGFDALSAGSMALAAERLQAAAEIEPENARIWSGLGEASEKLERFSEAAAAYAHAATLTPDDTATAFGLARLALLRGDSHTARSALAGISAARDPEFLYISGMLSFLDEEYETAVRKISAAVAANPSARNRAALSKLEEAQRLYGENRPRLEMSDASIRPIFPALYKTYAAEPIGAVTVRNAGRQPLERLRFSTFIRGAMDFPSDTVINRLDPGETIRVAIRAELSNEILDITEDDTKQAEIRLTYYRSGEPVEVKQTVPFRLYARTALMWDDPRKIASFVTTRAPVVSEFARNVAGYTSEFGDVINAPLKTAMLVRHALAVYGTRYQQDPLNPFREISEDATAVDHVQLPEETLRTKAGDCDDLVVLMASLLENLGVRTAVADLPGHVLLLFDSELPPEAGDQVAPRGCWVEHEGSVWIPIETTLLDASFEAANRAAAKVMEGSTIIDLHSAWTLYPPVTTQSSAWRAPLPDRAETLMKFTPDELAARLRRAHALVGDDSDALHVGIIFGRSGLLDEAQTSLEGAGDNAASWNNLGNIAFMRGDLDKARACYQRAAELDPLDEGIKKNLERAR